MAYEFLKKLFGTPKDGEQPKAMTYAELEAAIDGAKDIQVVDLKAGGYVAKSKLDAKITELAGVQQQLTDANTQIQSFKDQDVEGVKKKVSEWETKYNADTQALKDQMAEQARKHAEEMFLSGYKFSSVAAKNGILAELQGKKFQIDDHGTILGAKEFMQSLMENEDYKGAFVTEQKKDGEPEQQTQTPPAPAGPRFSAGTSGTTQPGGAAANPFAGFGGFTRLRQPDNNK
ncbi:phage scaffolding protein [uncultured Parasutterella sp.]|uniref:phage scaffolding protein n=1 Tax=uncultured Parasutterella sp. TaxID=1263098 RepID=UPI002711D52B|nr:phage scaffolding protein [uncultured Parasutterella sp.]